VGLRCRPAPQNKIILFYPRYLHPSTENLKTNPASNTFRSGAWRIQKPSLFTLDLSRPLSKFLSILKLFGYGMDKSRFSAAFTEDEP
jgi:hypothetical protein